MDTSIHVVRARRPRHRPFLGEAQLVLPQPRSRAWGPTGAPGPRPRTAAWPLRIRAEGRSTCWSPSALDAVSTTVYGTVWGRSVGRRGVVLALGPG